MFYVDPDFKTKKALKDAVAAGRTVTVFAPGLGTPPDNGKTAVGGPHGVHKWYAEVQIVGGQVVAVK